MMRLVDAGGLTAQNRDRVGVVETLSFEPLLCLALRIPLVYSITTSHSVTVNSSLRLVQYSYRIHICP
jgi:hypothetical protein